MHNVFQEGIILAKFQKKKNSDPLNYCNHYDRCLYLNAWRKKKKNAMDFVLPSTKLSFSRRVMQIILPIENLTSEKSNFWLPIVVNINSAEL